VTTGYDAKTVSANVDTYGSKATQLHLVYDVLPWLAPLVGLLFVIGGLVLARRSVEREAATA
jgi:hypothetical protein